jgi:[ribosomal protein S5]-alanine N-acetyltransferase
VQLLDLSFVLRTTRLLLRDFSLDDFDALASYQRDARYRRYFPLPPGGEPDTREMLDRFLGWQAEEPRSRFQLAIVHSSGELIGTAGLRRRTPESLVADLGYELAPSRWGQGYATEAARALLGFGFGELALHRVHAHCVAENRPSARVLERIGMRLEGILRQHEYFSERWWDVHWYGILASEWPAAAAGSLRGTDRSAGGG